MPCKLCKNQVEQHFDCTFSSNHCLYCGWFYSEDGINEIEILNPYCILVLNDCFFQTITSRTELFVALRNLKTSKRTNKIMLGKYCHTSKSVIKKTLHL